MAPSHGLDLVPAHHTLVVERDGRSDGEIIAEALQRSPDGALPPNTEVMGIAFLGDNFLWAPGCVRRPMDVIQEPVIADEHGHVRPVT
jgi:hypothetical protein